eukprot:TRINITY_DN6036_c1_g1_i1.p1 TRINITY_DN6036_c1_g1~~TRINITY_DN6036_c1_g1_i1.p1  ORF type:complete len:1052 (-),score=249.58 TRINITY_DN6036_c1_g1_i1:12-3167(-)
MSKTDIIEICGDLIQLDYISKSKITQVSDKLTKFIQIHKFTIEDFVSYFVSNFHSLPNASKLPSLYVIDSMCRKAGSLGNSFQLEMSKYLHKIFDNNHKFKLDPDHSERMIKLLETWKSKYLFAIRAEWLKIIKDSSSSTSSTNGVHVNKEPQSATTTTTSINMAKIKQEKDSRQPSRITFEHIQRIKADPSASSSSSTSTPSLSHYKRLSTSPNQTPSAPQLSIKKEKTSSSSTTTQPHIKKETDNLSSEHRSPVKIKTEHVNNNHDQNRSHSHSSGIHNRSNSQNVVNVAPSDVNVSLMSQIHITKKTQQTNQHQHQHQHHQQHKQDNIPSSTSSTRKESSGFSRSSGSSEIASLPTSKSSIPTSATSLSTTPTSISTQKIPTPHVPIKKEKPTTTTTTSSTTATTLLPIKPDPYQPTVGENSTSPLLLHKIKSEPNYSTTPTPTQTTTTTSASTNNESTILRVPIKTETKSPIKSSLSTTSTTTSSTPSKSPANTKKKTTSTSSSSSTPSKTTSTPKKPVATATPAKRSFKPTPKLCHLINAPEDVQFTIISRLDIRSICRLSLTSKSLKQSVGKFSGWDVFSSSNLTQLNAYTSGPALCFALRSTEMSRMVRSIDLPWATVFNSFDDTSDLFKFLLRCKNLRKLDLNGALHKFDVNPIMNTLINLETICISRCDLSMPVLQRLLSEAKNLKCLDISYCTFGIGVSFEGIDSIVQSICSSQSIKKVKAKGISRYLLHMFSFFSSTTLESVDVAHYALLPLTQEDLSLYTDRNFFGAIASKHPNLTEINVAGYRLSEVLVSSPYVKETTIHPNVFYVVRPESFAKKLKVFTDDFIFAGFCNATPGECLPLLNRDCNIEYPINLRGHFGYPLMHTLIDRSNVELALFVLQNKECFNNSDIFADDSDGLSPISKSGTREIFLTMATSVLYKKPLNKMDQFIFDVIETNNKDDKDLCIGDVDLLLEFLDYGPHQKTNFFTEESLRCGEKIAKAFSLKIIYMNYIRIQHTKRRRLIKRTLSNMDTLAHQTVFKYLPLNKQKFLLMEMGTYITD